MKNGVQAAVNVYMVEGIFFHFLLMKMDFGDFFSHVAVSVFKIIC